MACGWVITLGIVVNATVVPLLRKRVSGLVAAAGLPVISRPAVAVLEAPALVIGGSITGVEGLVNITITMGSTR